MLRMIDLFSGAGGMSLGFSIALGEGLIPIWANDFDAAAADTYSLNLGGRCRVGDIVEILGSGEFRVPDAEIVIGGPPCQGFSLLNKNRTGDPRKALWRPFLDVVRRSGAAVFVMENVPQILSSKEYLEIVEEAERQGYKVAAAKLCAADYGVPQTRSRAFILGCNFADPAEFFPPPKTHFDPARGEVLDGVALAAGYVRKPKLWRTVRSAIGDLPPPVGTAIRTEPPPLDLHFGRSPTAKSIARYKAIPEEGMNRFDLQRLAPELTPDCWVRKQSGGTDLFGRLWWDRPAFTIRTEFYKPEKGRYLHPSQHRPITHREAARLQSFPDEFRFVGTKIQIARQIGNAVPPLLAAAVASAVGALFGVKEQVPVG